MTGWYALDKYYLKTEDSPAYAAAVILNPSCRKRYISTNWRKEWQGKAFRDTRNIWDEEYRQCCVPQVNPQASGDLDAFDLLRQRLQVTGASSSQDEYESYANGEPEPFKGSPLEWWTKEENRERYPCLSKMAIDILSAPPMSAEPERVFSGARRTITWERMKLEAANVEKKECLKSWIGSGITADRFLVDQEIFESCFDNVSGI
jgi:hAT family C-terminal dimerisation region